MCISILRRGKCSWVLQFTHTHVVPNTVYSHEGTLSAGVNLYHSTVFKGIAYFYTKKEQSLTIFTWYIYVVFCFVGKAQLLLETLIVIVTQVNNRKSYPSTFHHTLLSFPLPKGSVPRPYFPVSRNVF